MAIVQISRIQHRRGLQQDLPQLASAELGFSVDQRRLFIGNGTLAEGAPTEGITEILTQYTDILALTNTYTFKGLEAGIGQIITGPSPSEPIVRSLQNKLDDVVSVKDFGAKGDGRTDDTDAIQRALDNVYGSDQSYIAGGQHRTISFPAGTYVLTRTLNIPPYTRMQGEGKRSSIITGYFTGEPLARFVDSEGLYGVDYGSGNGNYEEYHISDMQFRNRNPNFDQPCLQIDGVYSATFNRVMFRGLTDYVTADFGGSNDLTNKVYDVDRGAGVAAVSMPNRSYYISVRNVVFSQCDFMDHNYGVELNGDCHGLTFNNCFFDHLYSYIVMGNDDYWTSSQYHPYGISIACSYFRDSAGPGVHCYQYVNQIMSLCNSYLAYGIEDWATQTDAQPIKNPDYNALHPGLIFNESSNFSIGDSFFSGENVLTLGGTATATYSATNTINVGDTTDLHAGLPIYFTDTVFGNISDNAVYYINYVVDSANISIKPTQVGGNVIMTDATGTMIYKTGSAYPTVPYIESNGKDNYAVIQDIGVIDGQRTIGRGRKITLPDSLVCQSAVLTYIPFGYNHMTVSYKIIHNGHQRTGAMTIINNDGVYSWSDDYTETGDVRVELCVNSSTGDIEYSSQPAGDDAVFTYSLDYFN